MKRIIFILAASFGLLFACNSEASVENQDTIVQPFDTNSVIINTDTNRYDWDDDTLYHTTPDDYKKLMGDTLEK